MTFKHVKFEDSVVMRSLEKLAKEQGLVKEEPITKTASTKIVTTDNLTENVLTLCAGLRARGLHKQASEVESKFLTLKRAQTLYETSNEKGEDLVDAAHPKGSHKLEDVDGDEAVFETILDQHLKNMKMIEKTPTGKLASSRDVLRAVKVVLAEGEAPAAPPENTNFEADETAMIPLRGAKAVALLKQILVLLKQGKATVLNKMNTSTLAGSYDTNMGEIAQTVGGLSAGMAPNQLIKGIDSVVGDLGDIQNSIDFFNWKDLGVFTGIGAVPALLRHVGDFADMATGDWGTESRAKLTGIVNQCKGLANQAKSYAMGNNDEQLKKEKPATPVSTPATDAQKKIQAAVQQLNGIIALVKADTTADTDDVKDVNAWIANISGRLKELEGSAAGMSPGDLDAALAKLTKDFATVRQQWA